jgi:hypothetical protein
MKNEDISIENDLQARIKAIFTSCPYLYGFTVEEAPSTKEDDAELGLGLYVTHIGLLPVAGGKYAEAVYDEIGIVLSSFISERSEAMKLLRNRTFARTIH